jgi:hypothetical protein
MIMNKEQIGLNAGKIWKLLSSDNRRWKYADVKEATGLSDREMNTAIGWLARENKIELETKGDSYDCMCLILNVYIG